LWIFFAASLEDRIEHFVKKNRLAIIPSTEGPNQDCCKETPAEVILSNEGQSQECCKEVSSDEHSSTDQSRVSR
jgi:hypothetical protein